MIGDDFKIDFENKRIYHDPKGSKKKYSARELYSYLQDTFDEPENMKYDIPIKAVSPNKFKLINGWKMDKESLKNIKGKLVISDQRQAFERYCLASS